MRGRESERDLKGEPMAVGDSGVPRMAAVAGLDSVCHTPKDAGARRYDASLSGVRCALQS